MPLDDAYYRVHVPDVVAHHAPERMAQRYVESLYLPALDAPVSHAAVG